MLPPTQFDAAGAASTAPTATYRSAFVLVTCLFFMWGLSYGLLDVLNKHFQETLNVTRARSAFLQAAYFGAYFLVAVPAAALIGRRGYKFAILCGLGLFAIGALMVIPATLVPSFTAFLGAMFIIASGLAVLETAANPYVTLLGDAAGAARRLNLAQSFNGLGQFVAPRVAAAMLFTTADPHASQTPVRIIYLIIAAAVVALAVLIWRSAMPEGRDAGMQAHAHAAGFDGTGRWWLQGRFFWGVVAQFCYVAAQVGVGAFFINYVVELSVGFSSQEAAKLLSIGMLCFLVGRFAGTALMSYVAPPLLLGIYAVVNVGLSLSVSISSERSAVYQLIAVFFFMSIMFPTIFALAIKNLGAYTKRGSSFLIMSIVGGAIVPYFMGRVADVHGTAHAFFIPAVCFAVVAAYAFRVRAGRAENLDESKL